MDEEAEKDAASGGPGFAEEIGRRATRMIRAKRQARHPVWAGLGLMGMVGWSVAVPTLLGVFAGRWLDEGRPAGSRSWTLALLAAGLVVGCANAWRWVGRENAANRDVVRDAGQNGGKGKDGQ